MRDNRFFWTRICPACVLLISIILVFALYLKHSQDLTVQRNAKYIEDAAEQTAYRIDDTLVSAENSVVAIAEMYSQTMEPGIVNLEMLSRLTENTLFDYMGVVGKDGVYTDNYGRQATVSDRDYFRAGMEGNAGMEVISDSRISHETLMIFYAPLIRNGEVEGILTGRYREHQIREILSGSYFEQEARTYLCLSDGTLLLSSDPGVSGNIIQRLRNHPNVDQQVVSELEHALENRISCTLTYSNAAGTTVAYATKLENSQWMLLQEFPIGVTNQMLSETRSAAAYLELSLVGLFVCYIIVLMLENQREKRKLSSEKLALKDILDTTANLFSKFIIVDFQTDRYEVIMANSDETDRSESAQGSYSELNQEWKDRILYDEGADYQLKWFSRKSIQTHLTEDTPYLQYEYGLMEDGPRWKQLSILCLKREQGVPVSVLMVMQDVTELKNAEQESRMAMLEAYRSAQAANEAKRTFLFNMSHDMRTPMNAVIGFSTLLLRDAEQPEKVREYSRKIAASGQHLLGLINEVLDISKIESGKTTLNIVEFSLLELLDEVSMVIQEQTRAKHQILKIRAIQMERDRVLGDKIRMSQILLNLLSNAVKYTQDGGQVELTLQSLPQTSKGFAHLRFQVRDNGMGMDSDFLKRIYEPYTRAEQAVAAGIQGTGLGMTITRNLVSLMGGTISVESQPGRGTAFRVELEFRWADADEPEEEDFWAKHGISQMLVVDDEEDVCNNISGLMTNSGVSVRCAFCGVDAVEMAAQVPFDLILLDWKMPDMDGVETARRIRAQVGGEIPILLLTGYDWEPIEKEARAAGVDGFLPKPFFLSTFRQTVEEIQNSMHRAIQAAPLGGLQGLRLLVAEDNEINAEILTELLSTEGVTCDVAEDGVEAVERFRNAQPGYYDAVLMDIQMPRMNGYEASHAIRELDHPDAKQIPIIAMTANAFAEDVQRSLEAGMNLHLSKPVDLNCLREALCRLVAENRKTESC